MLLIDGVKYELWTPPSEDEFEQVVKEHAKDIFGEQSVYLDRKQRLKSLSGIGSIPDGYVIILGDAPEWHIVEVELSSHPLHEHIVSQVSRFITGIGNPNTQREIAEATYSEITRDGFLKLKVERAIQSTEIYRFLLDLISKSPILTVIIEKETEGLREAISTLAHSQIKVVEFQTFVREGVGLSVHAHLFEPLLVPVYLPPPVSLSPTSPKGEKLAGRRLRAKLGELVAEGLLKDGQILYFYHTRLFEDERAQVVASKNKLKYEVDGQLYPTSRLAEKLSQQHGLPHGNIHKISGRKWGVSGPKYWKTEDDKSLYDLFQQRKTSKGRNR